MLQQTFTLGNAAGLHARPASLFVQTVRQFPRTEVFVRNAEKEVNARSLLSVLSLGAGGGSTIAVRCAGPQAQEALAALEQLMEGGFGE